MFSSECLEISKNIFFIEYLSVTTSEPLLHDGRKKKSYYWVIYFMGLI